MTKKIKFRNMQITPIKNELKEDLKFAIILILMFFGIIFLFGCTIEIMKLL